MTEPLPPDCQRARYEFFESTRGTPLSPEVERHLETCSGCSLLAGQAQTLIAEVQTSASEPMPLGMQERVLSRLRDDLSEAAASPRRERSIGWWPKVGFGLATTMAAAAVLFLVWPRAASVVVEEARAGRQWGGVTLRGAPVISGARLVTSDVLELGPKAQAEMLIGSERIIAMANSSVALESLSRNDVSLRLLRGEVVVEVEHQKSKRFRVLTSDAEVRVTGTLFRVRASGDGTVVDVARGSVVVRVAGRAEVTVRPGHQVRTFGTQSEQRAADPEVERELEGAFTMLEVTEPLEAEPEAVTSFPKQRKRVHRAKTTAPRDVGAGAASELHVESPSSSEGECETARQEVLKPAPPSVQAERLMEVADCFYAEGELRQSLAAYQEVARRFSSTPSADNATYESGRVAAQLGDLGVAQAGFDSYLERFPNGPLAGEALFRKCGLYQQQQQRPQTLDCLRRYRSQFRQGPRTAATHYVEATLLRQAGDCQGAVQAYARYLEAPGPLADKAREWSAWCLRAKP